MLLFSGCVSSSYKAGGIKPSFEPIKSYDYTKKEAIMTKTSSFNLFWIWTVTPPGDMNRAIKASLSENEADNLINLTWSIERQYWLVGTVQIIHIKGTPIQYKEEELSE